MQTLKVILWTADPLHVLLFGVLWGWVLAGGLGRAIRAGRALL